MLRAVLTPWQGLEKPFSTCTLTTASHLGSSSPSGSFGKGSHGKETLWEGLTHGSAEPGHKIRERQREGEEAKAVSHLLQPQIPGLQGDLQPEPPNPVALWALQLLFPGFGMLTPPPDTTP